MLPSFLHSAACSNDADFDAQCDALAAQGQCEVNELTAIKCQGTCELCDSDLVKYVDSLSYDRFSNYEFRLVFEFSYSVFPACVHQANHSRKWR